MPSILLRRNLKTQNVYWTQHQNEIRRSFPPWTIKSLDEGEWRTFWISHLLQVTSYVLLKSLPFYWIIFLCGNSDKQTACVIIKVIQTGMLESDGHIPEKEEIAEKEDYWCGSDNEFITILGSLSKCKSHDCHQDFFVILMIIKFKHGARGWGEVEEVPLIRIMLIAIAQTFSTTRLHVHYKRKRSIKVILKGSTGNTLLSNLGILVFENGLDASKTLSSFPEKVRRRLWQQFSIMAPIQGIFAFLPVLKWVKKDGDRCQIYIQKKNQFWLFKQKHNVWKRSGHVIQST